MIKLPTKAQVSAYAQAAAVLLRLAPRMWSVRIAAVFASIALLEPHWPALAKALPPEWEAIGASLFVVARILPQALASAGGDK